MKLWQVRWFRIGVLIFSGLLATGIVLILLLVNQNSDSLSPTPPQKLSTPLPSLQGQLPEPKTLGVAIKDESDSPILMYHHIQDPPQSPVLIERNLSLSPEKFKEEINYLSASGYKTALLSELFNNVPEKRVIITFDDGYKDIINTALPILKKFGFRGVVFIIVENVGQPGYLSLNDLKYLSYEGWEIGSHSLSHPNLKWSTLAVAQREIVESKRILEEFGFKIQYFCYPSGKYNQATVDLVKIAGYLGAVTTNYGTNNLRSDIFELKRVRINSNESLASFKNIIK